MDYPTVNPEWEAIGDTEDGGEARDRLLSTIIVNGCYCHIEAIRVVVPIDPDERDMYAYKAADMGLDDTIDMATDINGAGPLDTATITVDGVEGEYVIVATSYS